MPEKHSTPDTLGPAGRQLWEAVIGDLGDNWELDARDLAYLGQACRCADELVELEDAIDSDGITVGWL